jgi:hypothetical protein
MMGTECRHMPWDLDAFIDGELRGPRVLEVLRHVEACKTCASRVDELRRIGDQLRAEVADVDASVFAGLASTVVSRTRAETAESWRTLLRRAGEDWHWLMIGAGSVAATLASTLVLSLILAFGPRPERDDSLSALIANSAWSHPDFILVFATPVGMDRGLLYVNDADRARGRDSRAAAVLAAQVVDRSAPEAAVVRDLLEVMTREGAFDTMPEKDRLRAESLLQQINRLRSSGPVPFGTVLNVHEVRIMDSTSVSAKGL